MRLIDADKLIKDIMELWDYKTVDGITATTVLKQTITDIDNAPTVKAIPIDWLISKSKELVLTKGTKFYSILDLPIVYDLIEEWRKENEKDN